MDELNIKGVDYEMVLDVAKGLHEYETGLLTGYHLSKDNLTEDQKDCTLKRIQNCIRFKQTLIDWLQEHKKES